MATGVFLVPARSSMVPVQRCPQFGLVHTQVSMVHCCARTDYYTINSWELDCVIVVGVMSLRRPS